MYALCKNVTDRGLEYISMITRLERLELYDTFIGDQGLENLARLRRMLNILTCIRPRSPMQVFESEVV